MKKDRHQRFYSYFPANQKFLPRGNLFLNYVIAKQANNELAFFYCRNRIFNSFSVQFNVKENFAHNVRKEGLAEATRKVSLQILGSLVEENEKNAKELVKKNIPEIPRSLSISDPVNAFMQLTRDKNPVAYISKVGREFSFYPSYTVSMLLSNKMVTQQEDSTLEEAEQKCMNYCLATALLGDLERYDCTVEEETRSVLNYKKFEYLKDPHFTMDRRMEKLEGFK